VSSELDEATLRDLVPQVIAVLVRRGADFAAAEDAVQDSLLRAIEVWPTDPPRDPQAWLVPEATMAQRISRAKRTVSEVSLDERGALGTVLRVLYLVFNAGYSGDVDLSQEAIRLARRLHAATEHPEAAGLLALMLLHHARRTARTRPDGTLVPLAEQDRSLWDTKLVVEGVELLQAALARDQLGEYQAQAAIAALHCDARSTPETDWVQVVEWYDELVVLTNSPVHRLNRAVAVG
jgi:predicted RNA polymerase sigma factor